MTDAYIQVAPDSSGKQVDNSSLVIAGSTVYRQRTNIAGQGATDLAPVTSSGGLAVAVTGGVITSIAVLASLSSALVYQGTSPWVVSLASLSSATVYQGTSPWLTQAATSGGPQPVAQSSTPWQVVASSTGGNQPVSIVAGSTSSLQLVQAATSGGNVPVSIVVGSTSSLQLVQAATSGGPLSVVQSSTPWLVVASTTGGNAPVFLGNTLPLLVVASTTGGSAPVNAILTPSTSNIQLVQAATSGGNAPVFLGNTLPLSVVASSTGGAQPVVQSATPWVVVSSTTGGAVSVSTVTSITSATVFQGTSPWTVVASTTGGAQQVIQSTTPWLVVASTTGGDVPVKPKGAVLSTTLLASAEGALRNPAVDTFGRTIVTPFQTRQLTISKYLQVVATGETVLYASSSGVYRDLLFMCITPATSNTVSSPCTIKDSSGGATQFLLNIPSGGSSALVGTVVDLPAPWPQSTATSTGNAWTVNFGAAGTYNVSALFIGFTT